MAGISGQLILCIIWTPVFDITPSYTLRPRGLSQNEWQELLVKMKLQILNFTGGHKYFCHATCFELLMISTLGLKTIMEPLMCAS